MESRIRLPEIPEGAVPYTVTPDVMSVAAGLGFGGTASTARMARYRDMLIARGYSPSEADELAYLEEKQAWEDRANEGLKSKGRPQNNVDANLDAAATPIALEPAAGGHMSLPPETPAQKQARMEGYKRDDARMEGFENEYNAVTGHPEYGFDASGNPARLGRVDIDKPDEATLRARGARRYQARAPHNAELEALNYGPGSDYAPADDVPEYADSTVPGPRTLDGKSPAPSRGLTAEEAEAYNLRKPGQLSQRDRDMKERGFVPVVTPEGVRYMLSPEGFNPPPGGVGRRGSRPDLTASSPKYPTGKYETRTEIGPDGNEVDVLVPTAQFKQQQSEVLANRRKSLAEERRNRRAQWQATAFLAGGSQNLNSGNRWIANALAGMAPDQRQQAMRYMLPGGDRQAFVDAQNMENANDVIKRYLTSGAVAGLGANDMNREVLQGKRKLEAQGWFDGYMSKNHGDAKRGGFFVGPYTAESMERAVNYMMQVYDLSRPEAEAIAQSHGVPGVSGARQAPQTPEEAERTEGWGAGAGDLPVPPGTPRYQWR